MTRADLPSAELFRTDCTRPESVPKLTKLLKPYIPECLPVFGSLLHSQLRNASASAEDDLIMQLYAWTSFDLATSQRPSLFSVIVLSPVDNNQARYFCSADNTDTQPTPEEKGHVVQFITEYLRIVHTQLGLSSSIKPADGKIAVKTGLVVGSVHQKWVAILSPLAGHIGPCIKFLRPPESGTPLVSGLSGDFTISPLESADIKTLTSTSAIHHSEEYYLSRCDRSMCIRAIDAEGSSPSRPVAWALQTGDGSIGTLYVQPEVRGSGLARNVIDTLVNFLNKTEVEEERGGALGWNWVDVLHGNSNAKRFFSGLQGWKVGWRCYWVFFQVPHHELL